jgi:Flp pilus assembly protein TadG
MMSAPNFTGLHRHLRRFARDRDAISAVEFAIILPFMVFLYIGSVELGEGLSMQFKATETARTLTDLASQYVSIDPTTMSTILGASAQVMTPYTTSNMVVTLSEVSPTNSSGKGTITWSCSLNGTARTVGASVTLPTSLQTPSGVSLIWGEVTYPYTPSMGYAITGTINIYQSSYFYQRLSNSVTLSSTCS